MDPLLPGGNDGLQQQSSEKLSMPRKTVDIEDSSFSWRKYNYGRTQLPGFLEILSMSSASCSVYLSPIAPWTLCSTLSRQRYNVAPQSSQTVRLATYICPRRHIHTTLNPTTNLTHWCTHESRRGHMETC